MKRYQIAGLGLVFLLCSLVPSAPGEVRAEEEKKIDLSATLTYVKDWAEREAFPDSPSFAFENVYCRLALQGRVRDADKSRIMEFLKKCQKPDGGFVSSPYLDESSNVIVTYFALAALDLLEAPSTIDREKAVDFILSLVQKDGGIKGTARNATANLGTTWYGVRSLHLLKALDRLEKDRTIACIKAHRDGDKGFGILAGKPSATQSTFMAVDSLKLLGGLAEDMKPGILSFLKETPYSGLVEPESPALMTMSDMAYVLGTAAIFSAVEQLNTQRIYQFVESLYIPENGGFGPSQGYGTTPPSTYYAVDCLVKLGKLEDPYAVKTTQAGQAGTKTRNPNIEIRNNTK